MNIRPLGDRVVVKRIEEETKTAGGILLPDSAKEKPQQGEVLAVGPGAYDTNGKIIPMNVSVGERVLFTKWGGNEIKLDGEEYIVLKESDIIGVVETGTSKKKAA